MKISTRTDQLLRTIERLESEIKVLQATGLVAPPGCWIVRYKRQRQKGGILVL
ncbi:MAG: hypothetical protein SAK29_03305 [Scytonema sp. PMC 1069.18]|nr:hypothetical protein [Scytonema sp. PMC 1069.18]MEC4884252.1 hypothetical protein [Scytonema sp. PMC 1070.18]